MDPKSCKRKFGHLAYDCRDRPKGPFKPSRTNKKRPNIIWEKTPIDNGCSRHMKGERSMFQELWRYQKVKIVKIRGLVSILFPLLIMLYLLKG
ncbi:hypothetical protein CR513_15056, partial [Mucuna pruriens]